ncbi:MAG: electron transfer flavoprotein subunit alpha/FixB family protein, partial [Desulfuromonadaceae bacterium]|nr:electron transfer flavoprotein subunit alpha/FixB family protein [Desulfuromonadaceae bacterium]
MKTLLVGEYRCSRLLDPTYELLGFAAQLGGETAMFLVGSEGQLPLCGGTLYLADATVCGEYNPDVHKKLILEAVQKENPDYIVFLHSSYGWDLAPRVAAALRAAQLSEVVAIAEGGSFEVCCCNAKMRRNVKPLTSKAVLTIQTGAFIAVQPGGAPVVQKLSAEVTATVLEFVGYEPAEEREIDLAKAEVIVAAGRGVGKKENIPAIAALAKAM